MGGALFGPAVGYYSKGNKTRGLNGLILRSIVFGVAWLAAPTNDFNDGFLPNPSGRNGFEIWAFAIIAIVVSDIIDIINVISSSP